MEKFDQLVKLIEETKSDADKFYNSDVQAAGTRVRGKMQEIKKLAQDIRVEVQDIKNSKK
ncbi:histone H1 [Sediminitomix flava]|uniref:Histone H1-like protein Hc1 n=1 Tax=Sediminitomix flava TaxID=379075 RepID=A0A315Z564_SEDFL|nr:histone H1 [Sediminitomix flava]PWJ38613.1 hypothetical protein BC781_107203 [Sediminitomix flava]